MQPTADTVKNQVGNYPRIAAELSGQIVDVDKWERGQAQNAKLLEQSHTIAKKMDGFSFYGLGWKKVFKAYDHSQDLTLFGLNSEQFSKLPNFRNISIIPYVARKKRQKSMKQLEYFLQNHPNCRMWTMTTGKRCTLQDLPTRIAQLHAKFGRVNQQPFMKKVGAKFVFRATEFGEICKTETGLSFHPHAHALLHLPKMIDRDAWSKLLCKIRTYFVYHSQDCGRVRNVNELVKYCVKPCDLEHLDALDLIKVHQVTTQKRLYEFLGDLRVQRSSLNQRNRRIIRRKGKLMTTPNWVGGAEKLPRWLHSPEDSDARPTLVAWCPPSSIFTPISEPCFIIHALGKADPQSVFKWFEVKNMKRSIKVHTKTLTHHMKNREIQKEYESKKKISEENSRFERISRSRRKPIEVLS